MAQLRRTVCALLLAPYFLALFLSLHAPPIPLPVPSWGKKRPGGPLGSELSPSLRTFSPHLWPHPIWILLAVPLLLCPKLLVVLALAEAVGVPILIKEKHSYLEALKELPEQGFKTPTFGIVHGWRTLFYSLYLIFVVRPDLHDISYLSRVGGPSFLPSKLPQRLGSRPTVPVGLPQRQRDQCCATGSLAPLETWSKLVECEPGNLPNLKGRAVFPARFATSRDVAVELSPNEGAGAKGILCLECSRPEVLRMQSEIAHEHGVDKSWHAILSAADAQRVCELGWAERGPPIVCKSLCQPGFSFAPDGWVFVYAPRDNEEIEMLRIILEASHDFAVSSCFEVPLDGSTAK